MRLTTELIKSVMEKKAVAQDEMSVPSYANMHTPDNHVGKKKTKQIANPAAGLGDRKVKKPTANVGSAGKERRDLEGPKQKAKKMSEQAPVQGSPGSQNPIVKQLGLAVSDGMLQFNHPANPDQVYQIEYTPEVKQFLRRATAQLAGRGGQYPVDELFQLLLDYHEGGAGEDPRNRIGLSAGRGARMSEAPGSQTNPIVQALALTMDSGALTATHPDGSVAITVPMSDGLRKSLNAFLTNPDNRMDTASAAEKLFRALGRVPGAKEAQPQKGARSTSSMTRARGDTSPTAGSGLSMEPMDTGSPSSTGDGGSSWNPRQRVTSSVGESAHKTAHGEMNKPTVASKGPAKTAKVRTKQNDAPANKGNVGTGREEKGQTKKQFSVSPKDTKSGDNVHKSMKKMHEGISGLEKLLGTKLNLKLAENLQNRAYFRVMLQQYMETALWSSNDESTPQGGEPMDENYSVNDIAAETVMKMRNDVARFLDENIELLDQAMETTDYDLEQAGHDFWLTRNGHGAGFWDRGLGEVGDALTKAANAFGEVDLYIGDDGKIYQG